VVHEKRVVHGDLKPANFLMVNKELKLIDFGIAKQVRKRHLHPSQQKPAPLYVKEPDVTPKETCNPLWRAGGEQTKPETRRPKPEPTRRADREQTIT